LRLRVEGVFTIEVVRIDAPGGGDLPSLQSVQSELSALKRKYARLQRENKNLTYLYKQAAALRDFNEKEKETQMRYNQMMRDSSPDDILLLDTDLNILLCTSSVKKTFGRDITGEGFLYATQERFGGEYTRKVKEALDDLLKKSRRMPERTDSYEINVETGGDRKSFFSITISPALDDCGEINGIVVIAHDNTEMHNANIRAEAANKAKSAFLSTMSHEIRTPLNAVLGITEIQLLNESLDNGVKEALGKIHSSGDLLLGIINDILDLSKIEAGKLELVVDRYEIASLVSDTAQLNMMRIGSKSIEFEIDVDENIPSFMLGDELRVKQILNNLLSNAFKYTAEGVVRLSISGESCCDDDGKVALVIVVSDTGQGMTKEQVGKLFDEYSRFNTEANRSTEGTGLGMSITNNLLRLMDGEIHIQSEPNKGSTFTVRIPQERLGSEVLGRESAENLKKFRTSSRTRMNRVRITREPMPYGKVLIVDDVETNIYVARGLMAPYELNVESADSGLAAIRKINGGHKYDIIFMDHMMPQMDGLEATKIIRGMGYDSPIVALTANAVTGQSEVFLSSGFDDFISKPIDIRQLNTVLNKMIRDKQEPELLEETRRRAREKESKHPDRAARRDIDPFFAEIFVRDARKSLAVLEALAEKNDYGNENRLRAYIISVHGLKSALANVGRTDLSELASNLEHAGREGKLDIIITETDAFLESLRAFVDELTPARDSDGGDGDVVANEDKQYLAEKLLDIKAACEVFNENAADNILTELRKRVWPRKTANMLRSIAEYLLHSDFDEIADVVARYSETPLEV